MEFVDGLNLRQLLRTRKFTPEEALAIVPPLCDALHLARDRGTAHRGRLAGKPATRQNRPRQGG